MMNADSLSRKLNIDYSASIIQQITDPLLSDKGIGLFIKRDDLLHPVISGNKWRKLKYNLLDAIDKGYQHIASMGGPWSNHLHALAFVGQQLNLATTGYIRGEAPAQESPTLQDMRRWGMQLHFLSRDAFRELRNSRSKEGSNLQEPYYWLPEGGANSRAIRGVNEIIDEVDISIDVISVACGTGATLAGLMNRCSPDQRILGIAALKGELFLKDEISQMSGATQSENWDINFDYHFGGFAKTADTLEQFMASFSKKHHIPLDHIYTGKLLYGLFDLIKQDYFTKGTSILAVHTGGLQGNRKLQD